MSVLVRSHMMWTRFALSVLSLMVTSTALAEELYVSPTGNDANPGTIESPLASLAEAKRRVRLLKVKATAPVTVHLRSGTYYLRETVRFEPADSGTARAPVTYAAYESEKVVISGGVELDGPWTKSHNGTYKLKVDLPPDEFDQLFVDGKRQVLARRPNQQLDENGVDTGYSMGIKPLGEPTGRLVYDPMKFSSKRWTHPHGAIIHIFQTSNWGNMQWLIDDIDHDEHTMNLGTGGWQIGTLWYAERANFVGPRSRFYVENVLEELDTPGEWYYDYNAGELCYKPVENLDMTRAGFVAAGRLKELFSFEGKYKGGAPADTVKHIHLRNLVLMHTARIFLEPYETRLRGDWAIARIGAVRFDGAEDCTVSDCFSTKSAATAFS